MGLRQIGARGKPPEITRGFEQTRQLTEIHEPLIGQGLQFDSAKVLDLELVFAAPINQGRLGDIKLGSNPGEGPGTKVLDL